MNKFRYSYFQLTFGQDEAYLHPEWSYARLARCGYDAIEIAPPKGRHLYFRDSNSLTPGYGKTDFKAVMRALKKNRIQRLLHHRKRTDDPRCGHGSAPWHRLPPMYGANC